MRQSRLKSSANDNRPQRKRRLYSTPKPVKFLNSATSSPQKNHQRPLTPSSTPTHVNAEYKRHLTLAWGISLLGALMAAYAILQAMTLTSLVWPALIMASLLLWTTGQAERHSRLRNISSLMLIGATTVSAAAILGLNGFSLIGVEIALLISLTSLFVGWAFSSRPALMLSTISAIGYLASLFPELGLLTGLIEKTSQIGIGLIPFLLLGQVLLAQRLRSHLITALTITAILVWVLAIAKDLPPHAIAGLGFAVAAAHYCLGKTFEVANIFGARLHTIFALVVGLSAALYVQSFWIQFDSDKAQPIWNANDLWWSAIALSMLTIIVTSLMRFKSSRISLTGIFIISFGVFILPLATARPDLIETAFMQIPGLDAYPGMGLVIGAAIISCCLSWIVSGLKKGHLLNVLIGTIGIGVEATILFQPNHLNVDFGVIFIMSLICALCVGGLIAGSTSDYAQNTPNYA